MKPPVCKHCGKCCRYQILDMPEPRKCRYLIHTGKEKYTCRLRKDPLRIGLKIGEYKGVNIVCLDRKDDYVVIDGKRVFRIIPGCPFNPAQQA